MARHIAIKRLLNDLKEVLEHPQPDAVALPEEANLMVWHANLRAREGPLEGATIHALLLFPDTYPTSGPEVRLFHALPHPNVRVDLVAPEEACGAAYRLSLWDCNPSLDQWCPAYSVASVLALLSSFLLDPELLYDTHRVSVEAAVQAAACLEVQGHPHTGAAPHPPLPTEEDVKLALSLRTIDVQRPSVNKELMKAYVDPTPTRPASPAPAEAGFWTAVEGRRGVRRSVADKAAAADPAVVTAATASPSLTLPSKAAGYEVLAELGDEGGTIAAPAVQEGAGDGGEAGQEAGEETGGVAPATGGEDVKAAHTRRKRLLDDSILRATHRSLIRDVEALHARRLAEQCAQRDGTRARLVVPADDIKGAADHRQAVDDGCSAGPLFDLLPPDALAQMLLRMEARDVAALGATCRALQAACADGEVWRSLLRRAFPASPLRCADLAGYRLAYELEASCAVPELRCFYSRAPFDSEVLGLPLQFTRNPKTGVVDYILPTTADLVSVEAVEAGLVVRDASGSDVQGALPVYITADHFERAQPLLGAALRQLCPSVYRPGAEEWLRVLPTALNTCAVMLCDHGVAASERALGTYCALHRLLLAMCERHGLWERAERAVHRFVASEAHRVKSETPSLGLLMPLLAVSRAHDWRQVMPLVLGEAVDRQVIWVCKGDGTMIQRYRVPASRGGVDGELVGGVFRQSAISLRLLMFHAAFLALVARPQGRPLGEVMYRLDCLYGRPGAGLRRRFQAAVKRILVCSSWDEALDALGVKRLSPAAWTARLRQSWANSLAKGYHSPRTNFARIQAGGVSRILLRGQRYSAPPGLACIEVDERWRSRRAFGFTYLDASCLIYGRAPARARRSGRPGWREPRGERRAAGADPGREPLRLLEAVDYSHTWSHIRDKDGESVVCHSGDMIEDDSGQHTLTINLIGLPPHVEALYLTMSAFAGAKLTDITQPYISVRDPASGTDLCQFHLEDIPQEQRRSHSSVVMLRVARSVTAPGQWEIEALGQVGDGYAGSYDPMDEWILAQSGGDAGRATRRQ